MPTVRSLRAQDLELQIPGPEPDQRTHRHSGALPLLPELKLRALPSSYDLTHLAVLPRNPFALAVVWAIEPGQFPEQGATLVLRAGDQVLAEAPVDRPLGSWFFGDLQPGQAIWAEVLTSRGRLARSSVVHLPPAGPSPLPPEIRRTATPAPLPDRSTPSDPAWRSISSFIHAQES